MNKQAVCQYCGNIFNEDDYEYSNEYLKECEKPLSGRDLRRFIVGKKNVVEKFADMNLHKGKFDLNGFYENVV